MAQFRWHNAARAAFVLCVMLFGFMGVAHAGQAKYVILLIGDGMGMAQRNAAELYLAAQKGDTTPGIVKLNMSQLPVQGATTTYSIDSLITDSAAAGTAMACGVKTTNRGLGVDGKNVPVVSIAEMARDKGMKVGIVSTVSLDHATPGSFYAHQPSRKNYYEIGLELAASRMDYFAGGGFLDPAGKKSKMEGDKRNVLDAIRANGFHYVNSAQDFRSLKPGKERVVFVNPRLQDESAMTYAMDAAKDDVSLAEMTRKGFELLDNPKGFFMMIEGGKVDWACHANDAVSSITDVLAFDAAVAEAMQFMRNHPDDTLVIVTGDHETGGMSIGFAGTKYDSYHTRLKNQKISYVAFDEKFNAFRKANPQAKLEDVLPLVKENFGLVVLSDAEAAALPKDGDAAGMVLKPYEVDELRAAFERSMKGGDRKNLSDQDYLLYGEYEPFTVTLTHLLNQKSGIAWTTYSHTGVPVLTSAGGVGAERFGGFYDNTDIFARMAEIMGMKKSSAAVSPAVNTVVSPAVSLATAAN
ncbi:alkaline phosphatase [Desulfovibrio desulfuricans]|uniref:alkaline phosphatase n=1 Tax=Desulfovibrio desulfuricans TaxID=876 RepID=UPI001F3BE410|nr:alkaline phosphatase [Desulfovibrio desulfuricans]UIB00416.1 alkaline phosphatase [Desulfovibrio desulfuricans]